MASVCHQLEFSGEERESISPLLGATISRGAETRSDTHTSVVASGLWFSGMAKAPQNISDVIVDSLKAISNVRAVLMGRSGDVYHIWTMIQNWTATDRKAVYAAQKALLTKLKGFELDFYVVRLDASGSPDTLVSDIPMVFQRAS